MKLLCINNDGQGGTLIQDLISSETAAIKHIVYIQINQTTFYFLFKVTSINRHATNISVNIREIINTVNLKFQNNV